MEFCSSGRFKLELDAERLCGGGVGSARGAMGGPCSTIEYGFCGRGEKGGVGVSGC